MIMALAAVRTWQTVNSGFFPPIFLVNFSQEHQTCRADSQVSFERPIVPHLKVVQPDLSLVVLETTLHGEAREADAEYFLLRRCRGTVGHEVFHLLRIQRIAGDDQPTRSSGFSVITQKKPVEELGFPD